ncbi:phosphotransferase family protein [Stackebrandtia endophytica]|nr:phosphotransferase [Stackebrandtia endophytica]
MRDMDNTPGGPSRSKLCDRSNDLRRFEFDTSDQAGRHARLLRALATVVPVPYVRSVDGTTVVCQPVFGRDGAKVLTAETAATVLTACGRLLAKIHRVDASVALEGSGRTGVLVHGDFGPHRVRFAARALTISGVVGWEHAHVGNPVEDLAWCEWSLRSRHPDCFDALPHLYHGYGIEVPPWRPRQAAMLAKCRYMAKSAAQRKDGTASLWQRRTAITSAWRS